MPPSSPIASSAPAHSLPRLAALAWLRKDFNEGEPSCMHSWVNPASGVAASRLCEQGGDAQGKAASASPSASASTPRAGAARPLRLHERFAGILLAANGLMGLCAGRPARCVHFSAEIPDPSAPDGGRGGVGGRGGGGGGGGGLRALALRAAVAGGGKAAPPAAQGATHVPATAVLLECDETLLAVVVEGMPPPPSSSSLPLSPQGPASVVVGPPTEATCIALASAVLDACVCAFGPAVIYAGSGLFWTEAGRAREGTAAALDVIGSRFAATAGSAALLAWGGEGEGEGGGVRAAHAVPTTTPLAPSALTAAAWALPTVPVATLSRAAEITPLIRAARASLIREYLAERGAAAAASLAATATAVSAVAAFASMEGGGHGRAALSVDDVLPAPTAPAPASVSAGPSKEQEGEGVGAGEGGEAATTTEDPPDPSLSLPASAEPALVARRRQGESLKLKPRRPAPGAVSATRGAIASPPPVPLSTSSSRRTSAADASDASFRGQLNVLERLSAPSSEARRRPSKAPSSSPASSPAPAPAAPQPSHALNPRMQLPFVAYLSAQLLGVAQKAASALARGADADGDADAGRLAVEGVAALWVRRTGADPHAHGLHASPPHVSISALAPSPFNSPVSLLSPAHAELVGLAARVHGLAAMRAWPSVGQAAGEAAPLLLPVHAFSREAAPARPQAVSPTHALSSAGQLGLLVPVAAGPAAAASDTSPLFLPLSLSVRSFAVVLALWPVPPGPLPPPMQHIEDHEDAFVGVAVLVSEPALPFPHPKPPRPPAAAAAADGADVEEVTRGRTSAAEASLASALVGPAAREAARALASHAAATALFACEGEV
jgi:hypothetical protein